MKAIKITILLFLLSSGFFCEKTRGVEIKPSIVLMPVSKDELFSFDLVISTDPNPLAQGFQATIAGITGPDEFVLTFDIPSSQAVSLEPAYWLFGNSAGANATDNGDYSYTFGDGPSGQSAQPLVTDDIVARYVFAWDGKEGDYTFTLDLNTDKSYILLEDFVSKEALHLPVGDEWYGYPIISADSSSFTAHIPEPTTVVLLGLGSLVFLRKRRAQS
ncbi:MAG: PEP-CTERM sorting domain-containing protein [Planctomycetota bacterium]